MKQKKARRALTMRSTVRTLSIKCYEEQLPDGWENTKRRIQCQPKKDVQLIAIKHDRDPAREDIWGDSREKPHFHVIVRFLNNKKKRVGEILRQLNVVYRNPEDEMLWKEHGVETVGNFANMATYLTHETEEAMLDGKELYKLEELVSNLTIDEIKQIREGYVRVSASNGKVGMKEMAEKDIEAYELGYNLGEFKKWYGALNFNTCCPAD